VVVKEASVRLRGAYDVVIVEGTGSTAEVNLKVAIVNMRLAGWADAPVVLVADHVRNHLDMATIYEMIGKEVSTGK
jgi:cobyric acid synthase